jgi:hypothetical protein
VNQTPHTNAAQALDPADAEVICLPLHLQTELEEALAEADRERGISLDVLLTQLRSS